VPKAAVSHCLEYDMNKKLISKPPVPTTNGGPILSRAQKALNKKLLEIDEKRREEGHTVYGLSRIYLGAIYAMEDSGNVDRFAHGAHGFRELMEKLARSVTAAQVPSQKGSSPSLPSLVQELNKLWEKTKRNSGNLKNGGCQGNIDHHLARLLGGLEEFFNKVDNFTPPRDQQGANLLKHTDFIHAPLPEPIEQLRIQEWKQYNKYFEQVAHHGSVASKDEFAAWVIRFEEFLHGRLIPQTTRSKKKLLAIIKEGEGNA
jgi:hypothetical protein